MEVIELEHGDELHYFKKLDREDPVAVRAIRHGYSHGMLTDGIDYDICKYMRFNPSGDKAAEMLLFGADLGTGFADEVTELMSSLIDESFDARDLKLIYEETVDGVKIRHYRDCQQLTA